MWAKNSIMSESAFVTIKLKPINTIFSLFKSTVLEKEGKTSEQA